MQRCNLLILTIGMPTGGIGYASKKVSKIALNSASYPYNSWRID